MAKILISDPITPAGIELFKQAGFEGGRSEKPIIPRKS